MMIANTLRKRIPFTKHIPGPRRIHRLVKSSLRRIQLFFLMYLYPRKYADELYKQVFGYYINWNHPRDLNEWINYLAFFTDTSIWTQLTDKYRVRRFVAERGLSKTLIPILGVWDKAEDIDFSVLPNSFAIKTNCSSGDTIIVNDKANYKTDDILIKLRQAIKERDSLFRQSAEIHYLRIKPMIICEELIPKAFSTDYKIWCFNGEPHSILVCTNRCIEDHRVDLIAYDLNWQRHEEWLTGDYKNSIEVKRPIHLDEMICYARILSQGFPEVRIDFYDCPQCVWFGEMTFTSYQGRMPYYTTDVLQLMGERVAEAMKSFT